MSLLLLFLLYAPLRFPSHPTLNPTPNAGPPLPLPSSMDTLLNLLGPQHSATVIAVPSVILSAPCSLCLPQVTLSLPHSGSSAAGWTPGIVVFILLSLKPCVR